VVLVVVVMLLVVLVVVVQQVLFMEMEGVAALPIVELHHMQVAAD
jgi:hypothetical protein